MNTNIHYVNDFLNEAEVTNISQSIYNIPKDWWYLSMRPTNADFGKKNVRNITDTDEFNQFIKYNSAIYENGSFCYRFYRDVNDHYGTCRCGICKIKKVFNSD